MILFGGRRPIPTVRPRGDTDRLPMELDISTSPLAAVPRIVVGLVFAVLGFNFIGGSTEQAQFGPIIAFAFQAGPIIIMLAGLALFARGAVMLADRRTARFEDGQVTVTGKSLLGSENWSEPLSAYDGVRWRQIVVHRGRGANARSRPSHTYHVLDLEHPDRAKRLPLHVTRSDKGVRSKWEHFAKLLGVPAIEERDGEIRVRAAEDVDKTIEELAREGKVHIRAEWGDSSPPPAGLELTHEGGEADPESQAIVVTIRARRGPVWLYGAGLALGVVVLINGALSLTFFTVVLGCGICASVIGFWKYEDRNPRTIRITRSHVELDTPVIFKAPTHSVIHHNTIESVDVNKRDDLGVIGSHLVIVTDLGNHDTGGGVSKDGLVWLRDLILAAVAKA